MLPCKRSKIFTSDVSNGGVGDGDVNVGYHCGGTRKS